MKIHDRYILSGFWRNVLLGILAFLVIYVTVDINEKIDNFIDHHATVLEISSYYFFKLPWIILLITPVSILLATVFTLGKLSRQNELTAFIASGTSLLRVSSPIIISALSITLFSIAFGEFVVPSANRRGERIMAVDIEENQQRGNFKYKANLHYQGENDRTYYAERYDISLKIMKNVIIQEYDDSQLIRRIDAKKVFWDGGKWVLIDGIIREFLPAGEIVTTFERRAGDDLPEKPEDLAKEEIEPEEMNFLELRQYIDRIRRGGGAIDKYLVDLYFKFSFPFTNVIFAMIGIALSSAKRKPSLATGFGMTLLISFTYYGILRIGQALGHSGVMQPVLAAWSGNLLFLVVGGVLLYRANR
ncbi:MAG: LptF/LptG family permease [Candidatus Krumholzibacteriota bacterium]|nr:LptF/LptG family permease [Candidatus Krumholzibacteriota bacterium]